MRQSSRQSSSLGKHLEDCIKACRGALQPVAPTVLDGSHLTRSGKQQVDPTACVLQHVQLAQDLEARSRSGTIRAATSKASKSL